MERRLAIALIVAALVLGGGTGWAIASINHDSSKRPSADGKRTTTTPTARPSEISTEPTHPTQPVRKSSPAEPVLTWNSYDGVTIGESMTAAAAHLGGKVSDKFAFNVLGGPPLPKDAGCVGRGTEIITDITPGVYIVSRLNKHPRVVDFITFAAGVGVGPLGIASGMTLAKARAVSRLSLAPFTNPTSGRAQYEIAKGPLTFAFLANPLVEHLTLLSTALLREGGIFDGGGGC